MLFQDRMLQCQARYDPDTMSFYFEKWKIVRKDIHKQPQELAPPKCQFLRLFVYIFLEEIFL